MDSHAVAAIVIAVAVVCAAAAVRLRRLRRRAARDRAMRAEIQEHIDRIRRHSSGPRP